MSPTTETTAPDRWRVRVLDIGSAAIAVLAILTLLASSGRPVLSESPAVVAVGLALPALVALCAVWRSGPFRLRAFTLVAIHLAGSLWFLDRVGFTAAPALSAITAVLFAGLLLGVRWAIATWALSVGLLMGGALLIQQGTIPIHFDPTLLDPSIPAVGVRYSLSYGTFSILLAVGVSILVEQLSDSLKATSSAQRAWQGTEAQWESLVDNAPDQILIVDDDHRIEFCNRALFGFSKQAIIGSRIEDFGTPENRAQISRAVDRVLRTGETQQHELNVTDASGGTRWMATRMSPVLRDGRVHRVTVISTDVSNRHQLEDQLRHSQKLEAVGQLASGVAHDFNNLLTVIVGYSDTLLHRLEEGSKMAAEVSAMREAAERGAALTRQLLSFSRQQPTIPQTLEMNDVVGEMMDMLIRLVGEEFTLATDLDPQAGSVFADRGQLEQVLTNLVVNARDAMSRGGSIGITTRAIELDASAAGELELVAGAYVSLAVSDSGTGMSSEVQDRIFDPFFTTKDVGQGTGLGLATAYGIVRGADGAIRVMSTLEQGSTFEVLLPLKAAQAVPAESKPSEDSTRDRQSTRRQRLLIVEDETAVRSLLVRTLTRENFEILEASGGVEALKLFDEDAGEIDIVLSDVRMPGMNGPDLAQHLRRRNPALRILFMSGHPGELDMSDREFEVVSKPFSMKDLVARLRRDPND